MSFLDLLFGKKNKENECHGRERIENSQLHTKECEARHSSIIREDEKRKSENSNKFQILDFYLDCSIGTNNKLKSSSHL